jgi:hypothetical protein
MTTLPPFQLDFMPSATGLTARPGAAPIVLCLDEDPATSRRLGSFNHDRESAACTRALPEKERIAPNQKSWPEMAERMGVKQAPKWKRLPEERGITEKSIGIAKGKRRRIHQDPYAGGERLAFGHGKRTCLH